MRENRAPAAASRPTAYWPRRFASVGTRSALAILTVFSLPPFEAGSAGSHVITVTP
jgi:hypothetical protein